MNFVPRSPQVPIYLQIKQFVQGLAQKRNQKVVLSEVQSLINQLGVPGEQYFLLQILESLELQKEKQSLSHKGQFLQQWLQQASAKSHFVDYFSSVVESVCPQSQSITEYTNELCNAIKVTPMVQLIMWLAITFSSNVLVAKEGVKTLKKKLQEPFQSKNNVQVPQYLVHTLLFQLRNLPELMDLEQEIKNFNEYILNLRQPELKCLYDDTKKYMKLEQTPIEIPRISDCIKPIDILKDLGPSLQNLNGLFTEYSDTDIMDCLLYLANAQFDEVPKEVQQLYKVTQTNLDWEQLLGDSQYKQQDDDFIKFFNGDNRRSWAQIFDKLDRPNLELSLQGYNNLMQYLARIKKQQPAFQLPHRILVDKWHNKKSQIVFLTHLLKVGKPDQIFWNELQPKKPVSMDHLSNFKPTGGLQYWANLEFVQMLVELSDYGYISEIREFFEQPIRTNPDLVILALFQIQPLSGGALIDELFTLLFPNYVSSHANSSPVLEQMWKHNQNLFITGISELYRKELGKKENSCLNLSRVLDIVQQLFLNSQQNNNTSLLSMAKFEDYHFSVPLGILAGKREYLNFDIWLQERIKTQGVNFVNVLLSYVEENVIQQMKEMQQKQGLPSGQLGQLQLQQLDQILDKGQLKLEMITIIFEQLMSQGDKLGNKIKQQTLQYYKELVQVFPQLAGTPNQKANQEVESKTDSYFDRYYSEDITLENFLNLMQQWKSSGNIQEKEVYACIVTNLYNEYQFHMKYPKKELELTGQLFGGVLERGLVDGGSMRIGLQIILVSLKHTNQRYDFAIKALDVMKQKIHEWPQFAEQVMACEQFSLKNPDLLAEIIRICEKHGIKSPIQLQIPKQEEIVIPVKKVETSPIIVQQPVQQVQQQPVQQVQQIQVQQIIQPSIQAQIPPQHAQSVTPPPTHSKTQSVPVQHTPQPQKQKKDECINLTFKMVLSVEYDGFVKHLGDTEMREYFTFVLNNLSQNNVEQKAAEIRSKLDADQEALFYFIKTMAYMRSPMTSQQQSPNIMYLLLATLNKPRLFTDIAKEVSIGLTRLLTFTKSNPTPEDRNTLKNMGSFLGQVTIYRDKPFLNKYFNYKKLLKQNHHTIYPLCKILEWSKSSLIFTRFNKWMAGILKELNTVKDELPTMAKYEIINLLKSFEYQPPPTPTPKPVPVPIPVATPQPTPDDQLSKLNIKNLPQYVTTDPKNLNDIITQQECRTLVATALDHAIADIIPPVISRSVTIALITTRELVFKDFALEPNEKAMLRGMHMISSHLSGSLAMVTCREPLKVRITHYLKEGVDGLEVDAKTKELFVQTAATENLDLGCALIKKAVIERALEDVNQDQSILEQLEKRQRYKEKGLPYRDEQAQLMLQFLPEQLQPRPTGLTEEELKIYEEFGTKKKVIPKLSYVQKVQHLCQLLQDPQTNEEKIVQLVDDINNAEQSQNEQFLKELADKFLQVILLNNMTQEKISYCLQLIHILIRKITERTEQKWSDILYVFIQHNIDLLDNSPLWWQAFPIMLNKKLMIISDVERVFLVILSKESQINLNGIISVLRQVILVEDSNQNVQPYRNIIKEISKKKDFNPQVTKFLQDLSTFLHSSSQVNQTKVLQKKLNLIKNFYSKIDEEYLAKVFNKLIQWYQLQTTEEFNRFFKYDAEYFFGEECLSKFCAYAIELSMSDSSKEMLDHSQIEQFAKMLAMFAIGVDSKHKFFEKLFDGCVMVITKAHESSKTRFNQRQLFKLFYNLLFDLQILEGDNLSVFHNKFAEFLERIEPNVYPGFSFAWLELVCNRYFLRIISTNEAAYARLIVKLLEFVRETVTEETLQYIHVQEYLKGVTRLFMLLLTDYGKFGSKYAFNFADEVPFNHVQLLNMSLAAFPNAHIDDPQSCTSIYEIPDSKEFGIIAHQSLDEQNFGKLRDEILQMYCLSDDELKIKVTKMFEYDLKGKLPLHISGFFVVLPRLEMYTRQQHYQLLTRVIKQASFALRNTLMNVILNQIRYPEKATEFYINYILSQFISGDNQQIQEQFTTLITKRFLVENPKTWGMLFLHEDLKRSNSANNQYKMYQIQRQA